MKGELPHMGQPEPEHVRNLKALKNAKSDIMIVYNLAADSEAGYTGRLSGRPGILMTGEREPERARTFNLNGPPSESDWAR